MNAKMPPDPEQGARMNLTPLTALSSVDGRYAAKTAVLRPICSEYGLIRRRLLIEIRWFEALAAHADIPELPPIGAAARTFLNALITGFDEAAAARIKEIEAVTNHDVKAVEYYLKERFAECPELAAHAEFLHFACTSEDINNLAYALMLKDLHETVVAGWTLSVDRTLLALAREHAGRAMLAHPPLRRSPTTPGKELGNVQARGGNIHPVRPATRR
jgi:adenylosuccinate lyase